MTVEQITYEQTKPFILGIHYARRMPCDWNVNIKESESIDK